MLFVGKQILCNKLPSTSTTCFTKLLVLHDYLKACSHHYYVQNSRTAHRYCLTTGRVQTGLEVSSGSVDHHEMFVNGCTQLMIKYAFLLMVWFFLDSCYLFSHIPQDRFTGTGGMIATVHGM